MALLVKDLIDDAQALAYPHIAEYAMSPAALVRQLSALDDKVVDLFTIQAPERVSVAASNLTVSLANNLAGYSLTAARAYTEFHYFDKDSNWISKIRIVPEAKIDHPPVHPAGVVRNATFFPADPTENRWATADQRPYFRGDGDTIRYRYVAEPPQITALTQNMASPDEARQYFVWNLVLAILLQSGGVPQERLQYVASEVASQERALSLMTAKRVNVESSLGS